MRQGSLPKAALLAALLCSCIAAAEAGEACTWSEALQALEQGNRVRGLALMNMAARDGDQRAVAWLEDNRDNRTLAWSGDDTKELQSPAGDRR